MSDLLGLAFHEHTPIEKETFSRFQVASPVEVLQAAEKGLAEVWKERAFVKRSTGEILLLHDIFAKIARWIGKVIEVGNLATPFEPLRATAAWAAVRSILGAATDGIYRQAIVLESVEHLVQTMSLGLLTECLCLTDESPTATTLKSDLKRLYVLCWSALAKVLDFCDQFAPSVSNQVDGWALIDINPTARVDASISEVDLSCFLDGIANQWKVIERDSASKLSNKPQNHNAKLLSLFEEAKKSLSDFEPESVENRDSMEEGKRDRILDSVSIIPYLRHHTKVNKHVLADSGAWLMQHSLAQKWASSSASELLWLHGIPGSGKTSLISVVIEKLKADSKTNSFYHPAYFYCNRNPAERERAVPVEILKSILRQLSLRHGSNSLPTCVVESFRNGDQPLDLDQTLNLILKVIEFRPVTYIILDALDECDAPLREELRDALEKIIQGSSSLVKILVSSRNDLDLVCWLQDYPNKEILTSDNQGDLARFIDEEVDKCADGNPRKLLRAGEISDDLRKEIKLALNTQAKSM